MVEQMERHVSRQMTVVTVCLEDRVDGGVRVYSDMLPSLLLSGADRDSVCDAIAPAIKGIFERKGFKIAGVYPNQPFPSVMKLPSPRTVDMKVHMEQFVVEVEDAA
jgi:hypothetical protein